MPPTRKRPGSLLVPWQIALKSLISRPPQRKQLRGNIYLAKVNAL